MADTPTSNTSPTTTKPAPTKEEMKRKAADMIYMFGSRQYGEPGVGKFKSAMAGLVTWGTHRDGRKGILLGGKFLPTSNAATTTTTAPTSNATSNTSSSTTTAPTPSAALLKKRGTWAETMRENFPGSFKSGGLVRGAGRATKGRGRGKMV